MRQTWFFAQSIDLCSFNRIIRPSSSPSPPSPVLSFFLPPLITSIAIASCPTSPQPPPPKPPSQSCPTALARCHLHIDAVHIISATAQCVLQNRWQNQRRRPLIERAKKRESGRKDGRQEDGGSRGTKSVKGRKGGIQSWGFHI